jgi:hypothetical protein
MYAGLNKMTKETKEILEDRRDERDLFIELDNMLFRDIQKHKLPQHFTTLTGTKLWGFDVWDLWTIERYDAFSDTYVCKKENSLTNKKSTIKLREDEVEVLVRSRVRNIYQDEKEDKLDFFKIMGAT